MQIHAADQQYRFKGKPETYLFQDPEPTCDVRSTLVLLTSVPPPCLLPQPVALTSQDYIDLTVGNAYLEEWENASLKQLWNPNLTCAL